MPVATLPYTLRSEPRLKWTATQEKSICRDYPFPDVANESPEQFVVRSYLQFLWLPQSVMPLNLLVPSLLRVNLASTSQHSTPHPLHALLDPLLLTTRASANKYHVELPQILLDGGGAGEIEETVMWFALSYEGTGSGEANDSDGAMPWENEKWRVQWLDRLERREVQIQILLHFLVLSLPGPPPTPEKGHTPMSSPRKRKKHAKRAAPPSIRDRLESFMDKLSMWQLVLGLEEQLDRGKATIDNERDWMQIFCQDLVEPQFKSKLPELCNLLRSKIFRHSSFSENSSLASSRSPSPLFDTDDQQPHRPEKNRAGSSSTLSIPHSRYTSPALSSTSISRSRYDPMRSRSRSLSLTLAQDADDRARRAGTGSVAGMKRILNREISMSRVFKDKRKERGKKERRGKMDDDDTGKAIAPQRKGGSSQTGNNPYLGVTLVADTPVKNKTKLRASYGSRLRGADAGYNVDQNLENGASTTPVKKRRR